MLQMYIKSVFVFVILFAYTPCLAQDSMCNRIVSCISLNGEDAIINLENNLNTAKIPFLKRKDALFTHFIWLKEYDSIVNILKEKSYGQDKLGMANLFLDIGKLKKGISLIKNEVEKGNPDAYVALGMEYRRGRAVAIDNKKAFNLYKRAKEKGNLDGYFYLGRCYEMGIGVKEDCSKAIELFKEAAEQGHKLALYRLVGYYKKGACGLPKDPQKVEYLMKEFQN